MGEGEILFSGLLLGFMMQNEMRRAYVRFTIVLTAYGTSLSNMCLGNREKMTRYPQGKCGIRTSSRKGNFGTYVRGVSLEQS